ncbi:hypothetical protein AC578_6726 [Pseudocercospora eumusae]|uniref:Uncharacterized protein n=1 Tax=Pseudocercospora eumusae TaxID=321146 RepID=A0A139HA23_9PEZI|nr:hypothetical protein AC578_6726 [Pseudocercospora eumusae]
MAGLQCIHETYTAEWATDGAVRCEDSASLKRHSQTRSLPLPLMFAVGNTSHSRSDAQSLQSKISTSSSQLRIGGGRRQLCRCQPQLPSLRCAGTKMAPLQEKTLADRIQALAQELQDMIFDRTIAIEPTTVHITRAYKAPWQLHINRVTRNLVAENYYKGCIFVWRSGPEVDTCRRWLKSLPVAHHAMIRKIRCQYTTRMKPEMYRRPDMTTDALLELHQVCLPIAAFAGNLLADTVFWTNINCFDERGFRQQIWVQLPTVNKMRQDMYWLMDGFVVHSWKQPPQGCTWDRIYR